MNTHLMVKNYETVYSQSGVVTNFIGGSATFNIRTRNGGHCNFDKAVLAIPSQNTKRSNPSAQNLPFVASHFIFPPLPNTVFNSETLF